MEFAPSIKVTKTDDRRNRNYFKTVTITVFGIPAIPDPPSKYTGRCYSQLGHFQDQIKEQLPECKIHTHVSYMRPDPGWTLVISRKFKAEKPSQLLSDDAALGAMPSEETITEMAKAAHKVTSAAQEKHLQTLKDVDHASYIMQYKRDKLKERAQKNTRLQQRMAALKAEFEAEYAVLCEGATEAVVKELRTDEDDGEPRWTEGCIEMVGEYMKAYLEEHVPAAFGSRGFLPDCGNRDAWLTRKLKPSKEEEAA